MQELDFTIEFNSDLDNRDYEVVLMGAAESRLRELAGEHDDMTGAAVTIRLPAHGTTPPLYEATVVTYVRPENIAAREKADAPEAALDGALEAIERQVRAKRDRLNRFWEQPGNHPVEQEIAEVVAAEQLAAEQPIDETDEDDVPPAHDEELSDG